MSGAELEVRSEGEGSARPLGPRYGWLVPALILVLSLAGIGVAGYLTYAHTLDRSVVCAGFSSCDEVANSDYAHIWKLPVAVLGLLGYVALVAVSLFWLRVGDRFETWPLLAVWGMALGGAAYSVYLTYVEIFVLEAVCLWCFASAVIMFCILVVSTIALFVTGGEVDLEPD